MADPTPLPSDRSTNGPSSSPAVADETLAPASAAVVVAAATTAPNQSKRHRRPSVRLGDPGEQPASALSSLNKSHHSWRYSNPHRPSSSAAASKTRHLTHISSSSTAPADDSDHPLSASFRRGPRDPKIKRPPAGPATKRIRSNWPSSAHTIDDDMAAIPSLDRRSPTTPSGANPPSDNEADGREWNLIDNGAHTNNDDNGGRSEEDDDEDDIIGGVRLWLNRLGLGRYAPVFEIHEVDEEVLPMLTLEDLKDMGINAVGSRRKMYFAIQKLRKSCSKSM